MEDKKKDRFEILRLLAVSAAKGEDLRQAAQTALDMAAAYVGLTAAALYLWDEQLKVTSTVLFSTSDESKARLMGLEQSLFGQLRREKNLLVAYMSFGGKTPSHSFTVPLQQADRIFGAVIGLQVGENKTIISEELFIEALSSLLALSFSANAQLGAPVATKELLDAERLSAIIETAVTVNHEVNNPLTAILGNVQLLLMKRDDLDDELKDKLKTIETSAMKIRDVTQRLMHMTVPRTVEYTNGTRMIDLSQDSEEES